MEQKVLLTGATGFLGKYMIKELEKRNYKIVAVGRNPKIAKERENTNCKFYIADFSDKDLLEEVLKKEQIDIVLHCGALSSAWGKWEDFYNCNVKGTENIANLALKYNVKRLVYISSPSIYSEKRNRENIKEDEFNSNNTLNYYIKTKIMSEQILNEFNKKGLYTVIIRPRGLIGIGDPSLMPRIMKANKKMGIPLFNNGENLVDITCVENVAYACYLAISTEGINGEVFNITNGEPREFKEILQKFCDVAGEMPKFKKMPFNIMYVLSFILEKVYLILKLKGEPVITRYTLCTLAFSQTLNIEKAKKKLNYIPQKTLDEGIDCYGKWWNENKKDKAL